jgi:transaldolase
MGLTTNPSIFEKAISKSREYDGQIKDLASQGKNVYEIYDELTVYDVGLAADLLKGIYEKSQGWDGYVSIEVLPEYAHRVLDTLDYARRIFKKINRPNIMVKVPGTIESPEAIKTLISEGINVNVTLLFSTQHYRSIAKAYIEGLKERLKQKQGLSGISSVASVFVSRIDTKVDKMLEEKTTAGHRFDINNLRGCLAVANSKMIYQEFKNIFSGEDFGFLKEKGAKAQRVLWASTSTKNPAYSDIKYVQELIGKDTINTLPHETVMAFSDHGKPRVCLEENLNQEEKRIEECRKLGINLIDTCQQIQDAGVKAFQDSFDQVIQAIKLKAQG